MQGQDRKRSFGEALSLYSNSNSKKSRTDRENYRNVPKVAAYSLSSGVSWQPCEKPFEHPTGIGLSFNFWMNSCLVDSGDNLFKGIVNLAHAQSSAFLRDGHSSDTSDDVTIIVAAIRGVDPMDLARGLPSLEFLSKCSCIPITHRFPQLITGGNEDASTASASASTVPNSSAPVLPEDIEDVVSLLLWPQKLPKSLNNLTDVSTIDLFKGNALSFKAVHSSWEDDILFMPDCSSLGVSAYNNLVQQKKLDGILLSKSFAAAFTEAIPGDVTGMLRRRAGGRSEIGMFLLRQKAIGASSVHGKTAEGTYTKEGVTLALVWNRGGAHQLDEVLSATADDDDNTDSSNNSSRSLQFTLVVGGGGLDRYQQAQQLSKQEEEDLYLELASAVELDKESADASDNLTVVAANTTTATDDNQAVTVYVPHDGDSINEANNHQITPDDAHTEDALTTSAKNESSSSSSSSSSPSLPLPLSYEEEGQHHHHQQQEEEKYMDSSTLAYLRGLYSSCRGEALERLVLSKDMLQLMGYQTTTAGQSDEYRDTASEEWSARPRKWMPSSAAAAASKKRGGGGGGGSGKKRKCGAIEEREEGEEEEEEGEILEEGEEEEEDDDDASWGHSSDDGDKPAVARDDGKASSGDDDYKLVLLESEDDREFLDVCAIDCEMCYTDLGLELTRVTVVCPERGVVCDTLVKPERPIRDYNTAYSGITEVMMRHVDTTMADVHRSLRNLISANTIIVGHSLDNDLRSLLIVHRRIIDTAAMYPHPKGQPFKLALKKVALDFLGKTVQSNSGSTGHDSIQDAVVALELALLKAQKGNEELGMPKPWQYSEMPRYSIYEAILAGGHKQDRSHSEQARNQDGSHPGSRVFRFSCHGCVPMCGRPSWERYSFGYRAEADACVASERLPSILLLEGGGKTSDSSSSTSNDSAISSAVVASNRSIRHATPTEAVAGAVEELKTMKEKSNHGNKSDHRPHHDHAPVTTVMWVDLHCEEEVVNQQQQQQYGNNGNAGSNSNNNSLKEVDAALREIYDAAPKGSYIMCCTQADLRQLKQLVARKQRNKWEISTARQAASAGSTMGCIISSNWGEEDDRALNIATVHAAAGAMFISRK